MTDETGYTLILTQKQLDVLGALLGECDAQEEWRSPRRIIGDLIQVLMESASSPLA